MVAALVGRCSPIAGLLLCASLVAIGCANCESTADGDAGFDGSAVDATAAEIGPGDAWQRECNSNSDCAAPTSVCDTIKGLCVECLVLGDCVSQPGAVCSLGACICPTPGETWCAADLCVDLQAGSEHCGRCGHPCYGSCREGHCADPWEPISGEGAPEARSSHTAVWTGSEMVVWGGANRNCDACNLNTGGRYDPATDSWRPVSQVNAPSPRRFATAIWTGSEMIVWGGRHDGSALDTGGRYDPASDTWLLLPATSGLAGRYWHTAVWTGTAMIVWGGTIGYGYLADGASYDPATDQWTAIPTADLGRRHHSAVWLDRAMLIYGGQGNDGGNADAYLPSAAVIGGWSYTPSTQVWAPLPAVGQPSGRAFHTALVLGDEMVVWGGYDGVSTLGTGSVYSAAGWRAIAEPQPPARYMHSAVVLDDPPQLVIWGGLFWSVDVDSGGAFDLATDSWTRLPVAPAGRHDHTAVSTGTAMIIWGGENTTGMLGDGAIYVPR